MANVLHQRDAALQALRRMQVQREAFASLHERWSVSEVSEVQVLEANHHTLQSVVELAQLNGELAMAWIELQLSTGGRAGVALERLSLR